MQDSAGVWLSRRTCISVASSLTASGTARQSTIRTSCGSTAFTRSNVPASGESAGVASRT